MEKSYFGRFIDRIVLSILIMLLTFIWIRRYTKNAILSFFISIIVCLVLNFVIFHLINNHDKKQTKSKKYNKFYNDTLNYLRYSSRKNYYLWFKKNYNFEYIKDFLFKLDNSYFYINIRTEITDSEFEKINDEFLALKNNNSNLFFIYQTKSKSFDEIISHSIYNNNIMSFSDFLNFTFNEEMLNKNDNMEKIPFKKKFKQNAKNLFMGVSRKHSKDLFITSISLLILSTIIPFSYYYLIIGSVLAVISIISLFIKSEPAKTPLLKETISSIKISSHND